MTELQAALLLLGCIGGLFLLAWFWRYMDNKVPLEDYDERQQFYHGRAFRFAFFVGVVYYVVAACILNVQRRNGADWIEPDLLVFIGVQLMICAFHFYCLLTQSALPFSDKGNGALANYAIMGTICLIRFHWGSDYWDGMPLTGAGSAKWLHLIACITFYALLAMHLFVRLRKEKE